MSELEEIQTLERQGFKFSGVHFKIDETIIIDMEKEGKTRNMLIPGSSILHDEFSDLFAYITRKIIEKREAIEKQRKKK